LLPVALQGKPMPAASPMSAIAWPGRSNGGRWQRSGGCAARPCCAPRLLWHCKVQCRALLSALLRLYPADHFACSGENNPVVEPTSAPPHH
jgi:hypothetical protein